MQTTVDQLEKKSITSGRWWHEVSIGNGFCPYLVLPVHLRHDIDKKVNACGSLLHGSRIFSAPALRSSFLSAGQNSNTSVTDDGRNCFKQIAGHRIGCSEKNWHCNCVAYWSYRGGGRRHQPLVSILAAPRHHHDITFNNTPQ